MSQRNQIQNSTAQTTNDNESGLLWRMFAPLIGMAIAGLLGVLVFGGIIVAMMGASVMGITVTGNMAFSAMLVGAIFIFLVTNA